MYELLGVVALSQESEVIAHFSKPALLFKSMTQSLNVLVLLGDGLIGVDAATDQKKCCFLSER